MGLLYRINWLFNILQKTKSQ